MIYTSSTDSISEEKRLGNATISKKGIEEKLNQDNVFAVSYDVYGYGNEIETYLFLSGELSSKQTCELREKFETALNNALKTEIMNCGKCDYPSFESWVRKQGYWCKKVPQFRVEPTKVGTSKDYCVFDLED